jgi:hypothetical protein
VNPPSQAQGERSNIVQAGSERSNIVQAGSERSNIVQAGSERSNIAQAGSPAGEAEDTPDFDPLEPAPGSDEARRRAAEQNQGNEYYRTSDTGDGGMAAAVAMEESQAVDPYAGFKQETTYGPDGNQRPPLEGVQGKEIEALTKKSTPPINYSVEEAAAINEINRHIGSNIVVFPGMQSAPEEVTPQLPPRPRTMVEGQAAQLTPEQRADELKVLREANAERVPAVSTPQGIIRTAPSTPNGFTPAAEPAPTGRPLMSRPDPIKVTLKDGTTVMREADNAVRDSNNQKVRVNSLTGLPFGFLPGDALPSGADATMQGRAVDSNSRQANAMGQAALDGTLGQREMPVQKPLMPRGPASQPEAQGGRSDGYQPRSIQEKMNFDRDQAEAFRTGKMGDFKRANGMAPTHSTYQSLADIAAGMPVPDGNRTAGQQKQAEAAQYQKQRETLYGAQPQAQGPVEVPGTIRRVIKTEQGDTRKKPQIGTAVFAPNFSRPRFAN